jgi:hypothetical protein
VEAIKSGNYLNECEGQKECESYLPLIAAEKLWC